MATVDDMPEEQAQPEPVVLDTLLSHDRDGVCLPEAALDMIWPRDPNVVPLLVVGKGLNLPPTCEVFVPCYEAHSTQACMEFVFSGHKAQSQETANVPLPGAMAAMFICVAILVGAGIIIRGWK